MRLLDLCQAYQLTHNGIPECEEKEKVAKIISEKLMSKHFPNLQTEYTHQEIQQTQLV